MLLLYSLVLTALGLTRWLWAARARRLERAFTRFSVQLLGKAAEPARKPGNASEQMLSHAKRQFEIGKLVQKRDALETRYLSWQGVAERLGRWLEALRAWKGKKLPYTLGAFDVLLVFSLIDFFGMNEYVSARRVTEWLLSMIQ